MLLALALVTTLSRTKRRFESRWHHSSFSVRRSGTKQIQIGQYSYSSGERSARPWRVPRGPVPRVCSTRPRRSAACYRTASLATAAGRAAVFPAFLS
jgi:hypothetical protein